MQNTYTYNNLPVAAEATENWVGKTSSRPSPPLKKKGDFTNLGLTGRVYSPLNFQSVFLCFMYPTKWPAPEFRSFRQVNTKDLFWKLGGQMPTLPSQFHGPWIEIWKHIFIACLLLIYGNFYAKKWKWIIIDFFRAILSNLE